MRTHRATRRNFLKTASAATAAIALPYYVPASAFGANERIVTGHIGVGAQGSGNLNRFLSHAAAVCDVDSARLAKAAKTVEAKNGKWLRSSDLKTASKPTSLPWFARKKNRWVQVSILSQTLVLWEGETPIYATLVSTGRDGVGDPKTTWSTPTGTFRVYQKHVTTTMDSDVADSEFELRDVPWVQYFQGGYALHAAYWHDDFGRPRSHGCINMAPIDARIVFNFTNPDVPEHWHGSEAGDLFGKGTIVHIVP